LQNEKIFRLKTQEYVKKYASLQKVDANNGATEEK